MITDESTASFRIVSEVDFPHGLRCGNCDREIDIGQPYGATLTDITSDGMTIARLDCVYCAGAA